MPPLRKAAGVRTTFQPIAASFAAAVALALPVIHISPLRPAAPPRGASRPSISVLIRTRASRPLADQLKRVATASAVGETWANVGMSFVAGPAGYARHLWKEATADASLL